MRELKNEIIDIIIQVCDRNITSDKISIGTNLIDDLGFDSISIMKLLAELEKHFHIVFSESEDILEIVSHFNSLKNYIENKLDRSTEIE